MYWQANANTPLSVTPLLNVPYFFSLQEILAEFLRDAFGPRNWKALHYREKSDHSHTKHRSSKKHHSCQLCSAKMPS